ncbi:MAG: glycosyltransferase family 2 protein [Vicinamibacterales bacterium]
MTDPLVSVVIPTYNHARFLAEAIDSLLAQDYPRLEVVVVDDGSTDGTGEILESYRDRIVFERQANSGQSAALNRGWALARGEILSYLNSDDVLRPGAVRLAVDAFAAAPDASFVYGDFELIDLDSRVYRTVRTVESAFPEMVARFITVAGPGGFFRASALERAGGWDPHFKQNPDVDFLFRLGLTGRFVRIPAVMAAFRVHEGSQTYRVPSIERADEPLVIIERFFGRADIPEPVRRRQHASTAAAHVLAARQHLRARRWGRFARHAGAALGQHLPTVTTVRTARMWLGALRP